MNKGVPPARFGKGLDLPVSFHRFEFFHRPAAFYFILKNDAESSSFELLLDHHIVVTGRIDQVNRLDGRSVEIVDYKTGKVCSAERAANDIQLSIYALAAQEVFDLEPERLVFHYLVNGESVACARDGKTIDAAKERIASVADQIRAGEFPASPKRKACDYCEYKPLCPAHEQLIAF